jgi:hypothetical protein
MRHARAHGRWHSIREVVSFVGWHLIMLAWMLGWLLGLVWVWPVIRQLDLNVDLISAVFWLAMGAITWVFAFMMGYRRYWVR